MEPERSVGRTKNSSYVDGQFLHTFKVGQVLGDSNESKRLRGPLKQPERMQSFNHLGEAIYLTEKRCI